MDWWVIAVIVILVVLAAAAAFMVVRSRRSGGDRNLQNRFGEEYTRELNRAPNRQEAEERLQQRVERHSRLNITTLSSDQQQRYTAHWREVQRRFVDEPEVALGEADRLISQAMRDRGYPTEHFEQKVSDLSVEHAGTVNAYREGHAIADRHEQQGVSTDELRQAMRRFRTVFEDVVGTPTNSEERDRS